MNRYESVIYGCNTGYESVNNNGCNTGYESVNNNGCNTGYE